MYVEKADRNRSAASVDFKRRFWFLHFGLAARSVIVVTCEILMVAGSGGHSN